MATAVTPLPSEASMSEPARILNIFIAPAKVFADLQRHAGWWGAFLLSALVTIVFAVVVDRQTGFEQDSRNEIARSSRADQFDKLPPDQMVKQIAISATITRDISYATPLFVLLFL